MLLAVSKLNKTEREAMNHIDILHDVWPAMAQEVDWRSTHVASDWANSTDFREGLYRCGRNRSCG